MTKRKPVVTATTEGDSGEPHNWVVNWCGCGFDGPEVVTWRKALDHALTCHRGGR